MTTSLHVFCCQPGTSHHHLLPGWLQCPPNWSLCSTLVPFTLLSTHSQIKSPLCSEPPMAPHVTQSTRPILPVTYMAFRDVVPCLSDLQCYFSCTSHTLLQPHRLPCYSPNIPVMLQFCTQMSCVCFSHTIKQVSATSWVSYNAIQF